MVPWLHHEEVSFWSNLVLWGKKTFTSKMFGMISYRYHYQGKNADVRYSPALLVDTLFFLTQRLLIIVFFWKMSL